MQYTINKINKIGVDMRSTLPIESIASCVTRRQAQNPKKPIAAAAHSITRYSGRPLFIPIFSLLSDLDRPT